MREFFCVKIRFGLAIFMRNHIFSGFGRVRPYPTLSKIGAYLMSRVCYFTGKRTVAGQSIARRGKAKYLGIIFSLTVSFGNKLGI